MSIKEVVNKKKVYGFRLPSLFGYSTFHIHYLYFDNNGWTNLGATGWYLEIAFGPPIWGLHWSIKVK
jgi:hypothetical protein